MTEHRSEGSEKIPDIGISEKIFQNIKVISSGEIKDLVSMDDAIDAMEKAFSHFSAGKSRVPQRNISAIPEAGMDLFFKPAYDVSLGRIAIKILTQKKGDTGGIPSILGIVLLLDMKTGSILAAMDGSYLTALRTGGAGGLAIELLARENSETMAIFGCGVQGRTQLESACTVRPVKRVLLYDKDLNTAENLRMEMQTDPDISVTVEKDPENLKHADIICTATNAAAPR